MYYNYTFSLYCKISHLLLAGFSNGKTFSHEQCERLLSLPVIETSESKNILFDSKLSEINKQRELIQLPERGLGANSNFD